jgi:2-(1,2-epoxy-1,2-dihydrophenyl)acetyl-CoA isomerase
MTDAVAPGRELIGWVNRWQNYAPLVLSLRALQMPVIAAINGVAAGAGCNCTGL